MKLLQALPLALIGLMAIPQANATDIKQDNINQCVAGAVNTKSLIKVLRQNCVTVPLVSVVK